MELKSMPKFIVLVIFRNLRTFLKKLLVNRSLPVRFRIRLSFQRCSFLYFSYQKKQKTRNWCVTWLSWRILLTALMKAELRWVLTVTLETNTSFIQNQPHYLAIYITLSIMWHLLASVSRISFVPMYKNTNICLDVCCVYWI